jgi:beta-mannosidase
VRRAYAPVLASFKALPDSGVELWITNDTVSEVEDDVTVALKTFAGERVWEQNYAVRAAANGSQPINRWETDEIAGPDRYLSVRSADGLFPKNRHFFAAIKDLRRTPTRPEVSISPASGSRLEIHLRAPEYAYFVVVANEGKTLTSEMVKVGWR